MSRRLTIATDGAPAAIGPYSQAVLVDGWLWCSGQIALDAFTGELIPETDAPSQARKCLQNLQAVLSEAGGEFADVVRCTVFLADMDDFAAVNAVYAEFFRGDDPPARATVEVSRLPKSVAVEISCVARIPGP